MGVEDINGVVMSTERERMMLLLGLSVEATDRVIEPVKVFLERMW